VSNSAGGRRAVENLDNLDAAENRNFAVQGEGLAAERKGRGKSNRWGKSAIPGVNVERLVSRTGMGGA
jgi:hypothetical protein